MSVLSTSGQEFDVKVYRPVDGVTSLRLTGSSVEEVRQRAEAQGYRVIASNVRRRGRGYRLALPVGPKFSISMFSQELLTLLEAGLSLIEVVEILSRKAKDAESKRVLTQLHNALYEGQPLSRVLEELSIFPPLYVSTLRSSERTGDLIQALRRYLEYHRQVNLIQSKVVSAVIYPALLLIVGTLVVLFLLGYVVPRFSHIYEDLNSDLPFLSRMLMLWGQSVNQHAWLILTVFVAILSVSLYGMTRPKMRSWMGRKLWAVPAIGERLRLYQLARFTRTLAMLLRGGIPIVQALNMVGGLLQHSTLRTALSVATREIQEGHSLSTVFERNGLATDVGVRLLVVGERSGEMSEAMDRIAQVYDGDIARWVDWFSKLFEPILMIVIGLLIGGIVLLMYMPIFELANSIQ